MKPYSDIYDILALEARINLRRKDQGLPWLNFPARSIDCRIMFHEAIYHFKHRPLCLRLT